MKLGLMSGLIRTPLMVRIDSPFVDALECLCKNKISGMAAILVLVNCCRSSVGRSRV
jgi:hypothetical protein